MYCWIQKKNKKKLRRVDLAINIFKENSNNSKMWLTFL